MDSFSCSIGALDPRRTCCLLFGRTEVIVGVGAIPRPDMERSNRFFVFRAAQFFLEKVLAFKLSLLMIWLTPVLRSHRPFACPLNVLISLECERADICHRFVSLDLGGTEFFVSKANMSSDDRVVDDECLLRLAEESSGRLDQRQNLGPLLFGCGRMACTVIESRPAKGRALSNKSWKTIVPPASEILLWAPASSIVRSSTDSRSILM